MTKTKRLRKNKQEIRKQYDLNKLAKVRDEIICPVCGTRFTKRQYSQAFCCGSCKDDYHNMIGDRHDRDYARSYNLKHPERMRRLQAFPVPLTARDSDDLFARQMLLEDEGFRRYMSDMGCDDGASVEVDLYTHYRNYAGLE